MSYIRKQFVKRGNQTNSLRAVNTGVPQGSVIEPILFLIFIKDFVNAAPMFDYTIVYYLQRTQIFLAKIHNFWSQIKTILRKGT